MRKIVPLIALACLSWACAEAETIDGDRRHHEAVGGAGGAGPKTLDRAPALALDDAAPKLEAVVAPLIDGKWMSGGVIVAVRPDGASFVPIGAISASNPSAPADDTLYELGSVSKTFVGLLLADAVTRGDLTTETLLSELLPADVKVPTLGGKEIDLVELTTHTSGLPRDIVDATPANWAKLTPEKVYAKLALMHLEHAPGSTFSYSNLGAGLLGHGLGLRKGVAFDDLLASDVSTPLGLPDTTTHLSDEQHGRVAPPQTADFDPEAEIELVALNGAGAVRSTSRDMAQYIQVQLGQKETPLAAAIDASHQSRFDITSKMDIGFGWFLVGGEIFHDGLTFGHTTCVLMDPTRGTGVAFLTNIAYPSFADGVPTMQNICQGLLDVVNGAEGAPLVVPPLVDLPASVIAARAGTYFAEGQGSLDIVVGEDGNLHAGFAPDDRPMLWPTSSTRFGVRTYASWMTFAEDSSTMTLDYWDGTKIDFVKQPETAQLGPKVAKRFVMPAKPILDIPRREEARR